MTLKFITTHLFLLLFSIQIRVFDLTLPNEENKKFQARKWHTLRYLKDS